MGPSRSRSRTKLPQEANSSDGQRRPTAPKRPNWSRCAGEVAKMLALLALSCLGQVHSSSDSQAAANSSKLSANSQLNNNNSNQQQQTSTGRYGCPYPPVNVNSQVNIISQAPAVPLLSTEFVSDEYATLKPDTQASYRCDHGYELIGQETIFCLPSGKWSSSPPNCVTNIALGKPTNQSSTVKGGDSRNANDGKSITQHDSKFCTETKVDQSPWWQIDLLQTYEIRSIRILGRACCNPHLSLHDIEIRIGNSSTLQGNRLCAWNPNNLDEGTPKDFQCAHPIIGRFVSIQMVGIEAALSLCEVMVFSTKEFPLDRCNIHTTLGPSTGEKPPGSQQVSTTTSATTTVSSAASNGQQDSAITVFNRTCYELQAVNGGSFLVADTYCKARGGSLLHSVSDLTQNYVAQELERMKSKLKSKLVWLGAKRETASPNAQGPITSGSSSALVDGESAHGSRIVIRSAPAAFNEFPVENLFATDERLVASGEASPIFSPLKLSRTSLHSSTGAGGATSRGSQTFGLPSSGQQQPMNRTIEHPGRSLIVSSPTQVASSFFTPPVSISTSNSAPVPQLQSTSSSPAISFSSPSVHIHRHLRPPALATTPPPSVSTNQLLSASSSNSWHSQASSQPSASSWRWTGDQASESISSPITTFLWADDQPNNYNNQQDCIVLDGSKKWLWNDVTCELDYLPWVCQYRASTCGSPDRSENSTILESVGQEASSGQEAQFALGKSITYACPLGHRMDGPKSRKCQYDGTWSGKAPRCQYVDCGPIGSQTLDNNGKAVYLNQSQTTYGSQVKYICGEDYVLVGFDTRTCQADGKWSGKAPYCAYKWCPVLQSIANGALNVSSYSENSVASYQCNSGYKLIGNNTRQCLLGGKWTNQEPFCQYVECGQPKQVPNASLQLLNGTTNYLSVVSYTCNENYTLATGNSHQLTCSHNNRWAGREPQCTLIDCGQPQASAGSRFMGESFTIHSSIEYACDPGYKEVSGNTQRTCGPNGQWSGQPLTCKYVDCGRVPAILKGEYNYINGTTYLASQVAYECKSGNRLSGHRVRFCGPDGKWTGSSPKCEEVRCEAPRLPANGSALYIGNDRSFKEQSFSVGVTVKYECDYGHVVKGSWATRLCQADGQWSGEPPECKFVDCGTPPPVENANFVLKHPPIGSTINTADILRRPAGSLTADQQTAGTFTWYGTIAHYSCDSNYKLQGPAQRECLESGQWRTPLPLCEPIQCPRPEFFDEYTQVALIPRSSGATELPASADHQAIINGVATRSIKLIANNQWLIPEQQQQQSYGVGDKLHFSCVPGYELYGGPEVRSCTQYGHWSGSSTPRCRMIDCGRPTPIGPEGRYYLLNETTTFNSVVEYVCVRPYKLTEVKIKQAGNLIETLTNAQAGVMPILTSLPVGVKVCANNGQWMPNDQQPKCISGSAAADGNQYDGVDNTLDGSQRIATLAAGLPGAGLDNNNNNNFDAIAGHHHQHHQISEAATSLWAKVLIAMSLLVMLALIILTLICIRSGKRPKQVVHRTSILTPSGQQAAAAAAAMQIQLANSKGQQQAAGHHQMAPVQQLPMMAGQNVYINGMHKMFAGSMLGQSQMISGADQSQGQTMGSYGDAMLYAAAGANPADGMMPLAGSGESEAVFIMNGKAGSLGLGESAGHKQHHLMDSYSRLSLESDQSGGVNSHHSANSNNKTTTIRHNPNGLVTFVSPSQQQQQLTGPATAAAAGRLGHSQSQLRSAARAVNSSTSQHQVSPQSISTSVSLSSTSPSSSSSAHHTTATRLSGTDSAPSPTSNSLAHRTNNIELDANHYHAPQYMPMAHHHHHQSSAVPPPPPQTQPPSLPAQPPPPHRVQQHHKQLLKHQQNPARVSSGLASTQRQSADQVNEQQRQPADGSSGSHYFEARG